MAAAPVVPNADDFKGYMRCCISCKQPWMCDPTTVNELATYMSFGMKGVVQKLNGSQNAHTEHYFGLELNEAHIIQRAHQTQAVIWACDPAFDVTSPNPPPIFQASRADWGGADDFRYTGQWNAPTDNIANAPNQIVKHKKVRDWLFSSGTVLQNNPTIPETLFTCEACNAVMDNEAKIIQVLYGKITQRNIRHIPGLIPPGLITTTVTRRNAAQPPQVFPQPLSQQFYQDTRGCLIAWYLHSCLVYLAENQNLPAFNQKRNLAVLLSWFPFMVYLKYLDYKKSNTRKPNYTFKGQIDLYISLHQYICLKAEFPALFLSFSRFHTFYFSEFPECQVVIDQTNNQKFWDPATYPYVHSKIFFGLDLNLPHKILIQRISNRLMALYESYTKVMAQAVLMQQVNYTTTQLHLQRYFIAPADLNVIYNKLPPDNIPLKYFSLQQYVEVAGITALLYPFFRYCDEKPDTMRKTLSKWMKFMFDNFEWKNIALNGKVNSMLLNKMEAVLTYKYQYVLNLDDFVDNTNMTMYEFLQRYDTNFLLNKIKSEKICSIFKAVPRLIQYDFTKDDWKARYLENNN